MVAAVVGGLWLGPRAQGRAVVVDVVVSNPDCVEAVALSWSQDRTVARSVVERLPRSGTLRYEAKLPDGRYRFRAALRCAGGVAKPADERPVDVSEDLELPLTISSTCSC